MDPTPPPAPLGLQSSAFLPYLWTERPATTTAVVMAREGLIERAVYRSGSIGTKRTGIDMWR